MLKDLERVHQKVGRIDAIFFTGDLTQRGQEFEAFDKVLSTIRNKLQSLGSSPVFLAVPGNHDLVRPDPDSSVMDGLKRWNDDAGLRERFWKNTKNDYRRAVKKAFKPWSKWANTALSWRDLHDVRRDGLLYGDFAATWTRDDLKIGILGLNTAALQLGAGDYRGRLSVHPRQVSELVGKLHEWVNRHDACFLLTHHDKIWLDEDGLRAWNGEIDKPGRFVAHLCGHRHQQAQTVVVKGGASPRRTVIGRSLFGLETYEHEGGRKDRLHGYTVGVIEFGASRTMRLWPRRDELQQAGHREIRADQSVALEPDEGTRQEDLGRGPRPPRSRPGSALEKGTPTPPPTPASGSPLDGWVEITAEYLDARRRDVDDEALRLFYDGQEPDWTHALLGDDRIPRRQVVREAVQRLQHPTAMTMVLLVAAGGEGKSMALRQVAVDLVRTGHRVLWREDEGTLHPEAVVSLPEGESWVLVSDDGEAIAGALESVLKKLRGADRRDVHWLVGARDTDWRGALPRRRGGEPPWSRWVSLWPSETQRCAAFALRREDAARVIACWDAIGSLGALDTLSEGDRVDALMRASQRKQGVSDGTFFGAILEARFGAAGLRAHLETVLHRLAVEHHELGNGYSLRDAFLYAAAAEAVGIDGVDLKVVAALVGVERSRRRPAILHRLGQEAVAAGGEALRTRAPAIARTTVQLVEEGRIDDDLEEIYTGLVRVTGELGRDGGRIVSHGAIMHCGPRLARELPELGVGQGRAYRIARAAVDEAARVVSTWIGLRVTQARTCRATGTPKEGSNILREALATPDAFDDWESKARSALYELGVCEGESGNRIGNIWTAGLSLADGPKLGGVTREDAKLSLAGLGAACLKIGEQRSLDEPFRKLLRATSVLGPRVTPDDDTRSAGYFQRHESGANRLRVANCSVEEALGWLADAVEYAGRKVADPVLRETADDLVGRGPLGFQRLRHALELGSGNDGPPSA